MTTELRPDVVVEVFSPSTNRVAANRIQGERDATQPPARTELDVTNSR